MTARATRRFIMRWSWSKAERNRRLARATGVSLGSNPWHHHRCDYFGPDAGCGFLASGTRNCVWQCWHLTSFPRTSSVTLRNFRQRRFGQISWTVIPGISRLLSADASSNVYLIGEKSVGVINLESTLETSTPSFSDSALAFCQSVSSENSFHAFSRASRLGYAKM